MPGVCFSVWFSCVCSFFRLEKCMKIDSVTVAPKIPVFLLILLTPKVQMPNVTFLLLDGVYPNIHHQTKFIKAAWSSDSWISVTFQTLCCSVADIQFCLLLKRFITFSFLTSIFFRHPFTASGDYMQASPTVKGSLTDHSVSMPCFYLSNTSRPLPSFLPSLTSSSDCQWAWRGPWGCPVTFTLWSF